MTTPGGTGSQSLSEIYGYPVPDTWVADQNPTAAELNANVRDAQNFIANAPLTIVQRAATQSVTTSTQTTISWDTEIIDMQNLITVPATGLTIKSPGIYSIQINVSFAAATGGSIRSCHILVNGNVIASHNDSPTLSGVTVLACSQVTALNVGDIVTVNVFQDSGGTVNAGNFGAAPRLAIRLISTAQTTLTYNPVTGKGTSSGAKPPASKPPTSHTPTKHVTSFGATYSRSYISSGATRYDDPSTCYQGAYPGYGGNQRSLIGFNQTSIQSTLSGASRITCTFSFRPAHAYYNSGLTAIIGSHNYGSKPGSWSTGQVYENQLHRASCAADHTYTVALTSWHGWAFQTGTINGMAFGPAPNTSLTYYGYMYGAGSGSKPSLTFTYYK